MVAAFERILGAAMFFGTERTTASARVVHRARFNFSSEARSWYQRGEDDGVGEAAITLNEEFFAEVMAHPIPADLERSKGWSPRPE